MTSASGLVVEGRRRGGLSQRELARLAGSSGPAVAAVESGARDPRFSTVERLLANVGEELVAVPARSRNERFVDAYCSTLAAAVLADPTLLDRARDDMVARSPSHSHVEGWHRLLDAGPLAVAGVLTSLAPEVRGFKQSNPFGRLGVIDEVERRRLLALS